MTKIISEIGVNWNGDLSTARYMITKSKLAGADYVKFQLFNEKIIRDTEYEQLLSKMILGAEELVELREQADFDDIGFIVSCMYPESFELAKLVNPDFIKIRHFDRGDDVLAKLAVDYYNETGTKVIVSSDSYAGISEIYRENPFSCYYMYCIPRYPPTKLDEKVILKHHSFLDHNTLWSGFSSHFKNVSVPTSAISENAKFLEVHVSCFESDIDRNVSITFDQLETLCNINRDENK